MKTSRQNASVWRPVVASAALVFSVAMAVKPADPQLAQAASARTEALAPSGVEDCTDSGRSLARDSASVTNTAMGRRPLYSQHIPCRKDSGMPQESSDSSAHPLAPGHRMI